VRGSDSDVEVPAGLHWQADGRLRQVADKWRGDIGSWHALVAVLCALVAGLGCPSGDGPGDILTSGKKLYSQYDEELVIRDFFQDRREGFFVDVGAYHWRDGSTTYYLEKHLGWSGIAIDALEQVGVGYEQNRPRTRFFNYIVTDHSGTMDTFYSAGPLSSTHKDHVGELAAMLDDAAAPDHPSNSPVDTVREAWEHSSDRIKGLGDFQPKEIQVPTITLTELLDRNGVSTIDFLSMDIERGEPAALAGFDIERFRPKLVCVEASHAVQGNLGTYFERHGYERIDEYQKFDQANWYFTPKDGSAPE
jgi:FkbM family methyltransferase